MIEPKFNAEILSKKAPSLPSVVKPYLDAKKSIQQERAKKAAKAASIAQKEAQKKKDQVNARRRRKAAGVKRSIEHVYYSTAEGRKPSLRHIDNLSTKQYEDAVTRGKERAKQISASAPAAKPTRKPSTKANGTKSAKPALNRDAADLYND